MQIKSMSCCGLKELWGLEINSRQTILAFFSLRPTGGGKGAFFVFTDTIAISNKGINLARYIERSNLGTVATLTAKINPNSANTLQAWLWSPNETGLRRWKKEQTKKSKKK